MANSAQARKRARQAERRRIQNSAKRSEFRTAIKKVLSAIESGEKDKAADAYKAAVPTIDKMAGNGIINKNRAARHKSRLNGHIRAM
ncbi:MAG: 30S ribosomal protein S20 [Thiotrichales bacterium]|nr:30S ribosomal protein S20 [Thiotrichales bacterium]